MMKNTMRILCSVFVLLSAQSAIADGTPSKKEGLTNIQMPADYQKGDLGTRKTNIGVRLSYEFLGSGLDSAGLLTLKIARQAGGEAASLELRPDAAISLPVGLPSPRSPFNPGAEYVVKVKPSADGLNYINVFVQAGHASEAMAIPVQVGKNAKLSKTGNVSTTPDGRRLIAVPAR
jgi:hypothetical protein